MAGATLANATSSNDLFAWCHECKRGDWLDVAALEAKFGPDAEIPDLAARLRCQGCGQTGTSGITLHHRRRA